MKLIIGLGNIGNEYCNTRHNLGFQCLDAYAEAHGLKFKKASAFSFSQTSSAILIKPRTYMNKSGIALQAAQKKWTPSEVLVVSDDLELPLSELRIREGGGTGGHNGIASLIEYAESNSLKRIRLGIGRDQSVPAHEYVLQPFSDMELELLKPQIEFVVKLLNIYIRFSFSKVLDEFSKWKKNKPNPIDALSG